MEKGLNYFWINSFIWINILISFFAIIIIIYYYFIWLFMNLLIFQNILLNYLLCLYKVMKNQINRFNLEVDSILNF
jgi:uncharacterized membrane protein YjjP (DUF1212 family)